jgi:DNA-binding transcriptional regulator YdaS (Cro superfamily)
MVKPRRRKNKPVATRRSNAIISLQAYMNEISRIAGRGQMLAERERFARRCGTSVQYLYQLAYGVRRAQPAVAIRIEQGSFGLVKAEALCPDFDWFYAQQRRVQPREQHEPRPPTGNIEITAPISEPVAA